MMPAPYDIPDIPNDDIVYFGQRAEPLFPLSLVGGGITDPDIIKKVFDLDDPVAWFSHTADEARHLYDFFNVKSELENFQKQVRAKLQSDGTRYVDALLEGCVKVGEDLIALSERLVRTHADTSLTRQALAETLDTFAKAAKDFCVFYTIAHFEKPESDIVRDVIDRHTPAESRAEVFDAITTASKRTDTDAEQDDFLALAGTVFESEKDRVAAATAHASRFGWLGVRFCLGTWWSAQDVLERLEHVVPEDASRMAHDRAQAHADIETIVQDFKARLAPADAHLVDQARAMVYLRTQRADYFNHACAIIKPLIEESARALGVSYHDLLHFSPDEVVAALRREYVLDAELAKRKTDSLTYINDGRIATLSGADASAYVAARNIFDRRADSAETLRGTAAYRGTVQGRARVVLTSADSHRVEKGDVLVAIMTTPDFIAAMERAAAFVTDEGGILSHAAIIAREMKKPCIIGTKHATKVLKDGDVVEVDADKGVIRILE